MSGSLIERDSALSAVAEAVERIRAGRGAALVVVGDAGTGKSAVVRAAVRLAGGELDVAVGRGVEMERGIAWGLLQQVAGAIGRDLVDVAAAPALVPTAPCLRVLGALERRRGRPLLLALDDLHWADPDSLELVAFLARRLARLPVGLVAALRPWPPAAHAAVGALVTEGRGRCVTLAPLSAPASAALLAERTGAAVSPADAARAWSLCRGNPLLIEQYAAALARGPADPGADGGRAAWHPRAGGPGPGAPSAAGRGLLVARFAGLDRASMRLLRCASVAGTRFRAELAVELADLDAQQADRTLEALAGSGLVRDGDDGRLHFAHPLFAHALYEQLPSALRRRLHARMFERLAARGRLDEAAEHAIRADLDGCDEAAALLERVGRAALHRGAVASAARTLAAAARFRGDHAAADLLLVLARALCACGRIPDAADACRRLLARPELTWEDRVAALVVLGRCQYLAGDADHGEAVLAQAVALAERHRPARAVAPLLDQAVSVWADRGPAAALPLARRACELADGVEPELYEAARASYGQLRAECGDPAGFALTEPLARRLRGEAAALPAAELVTPRAAIYSYAHCAQYAERLDASLAALTLARRQIEAAGAANALAIVSLFTGTHLLRRGRLREAVAAADRADRHADLTPMLMPIAALVRALALVWQGQRTAAAAELARAEPFAAGSWLVALWSAHARGLQLLWDGDPAASDALLECERVGEVAGIGEPNHTQWAGHAIAAHLLAGRDGDAGRVLERLERRAAVLPSRWPRFAAAVGRARLADRDGDEAAALAGYERALELLGDVDLPLQRAEGLIAWGAALRRSGRKVAARSPLARALRTAEAHGARPLADAAALELRLAGGRRRRDRDRDLLTPAESRVARGAAAGRTNAEIARSLHLAVSTVETHLKRVYAKLEVTGRRQLADVDLDAHAAPARRR